MSSEIKEKYSFLKSLLGRTIYNDTKQYAMKWVPPAFLFLVGLFGLSRLVHWEFLSAIMNITYGWTLLYIIFAFGMVVLLDRGVPANYTKAFYDSEYKVQDEEPKGFTGTILWGCLLIVLAIVSVHFTHKYKRHYAFECETFLMDYSTDTYHYRSIPCETADAASSLTKLRGYEIDETKYRLCEECEEIAEE